MNTAPIFLKDTPTDHDILDVIKNRWSPRSFSQEPVSTETLNKLFEAFRWAPSAMNEQPGRLLVGLKGDTAHQSILECLMPGNQTWAGNAPVLIVTLIKKTFSKTGAENGTAKHDLGLAVANLSTQATHEGIGIHQMGGVYLDKIKNAFNISDDYEPVTVLALGYYGDPEDLQDELKQREIAPRSRKSINEIVHYGDFK